MALEKSRSKIRTPRDPTLSFPTTWAAIGGSKGGKSCHCEQTKRWTQLLHNCHTKAGVEQNWHILWIAVFQQKNPLGFCHGRFRGSCPHGLCKIDDVETGLILETQHATQSQLGSIIPEGLNKLGMTIQLNKTLHWKKHTANTIHVTEFKTELDSESTSGTSNLPVRCVSVAKGSSWAHFFPSWSAVPWSTGTTAVLPRSYEWLVVHDGEWWLRMVNNRWFIQDF